MNSWADKQLPSLYFYNLLTSSKNSTCGCETSAKQRAKQRAAKQRAADVAAQEARDAAAAKQRADDAAQLRALCNRVDEHFMVTTHQGRSVAAGLARLKTEPASAKPALAWSAAEVRAWFAASARWPQYEPHFARYDGEALFGITRAEQLSALGVLPEHAAPLLADLMALL
jgi:hypothetical protein